MNNFLLFVGGLLVLVLGAAFSVPQFVNWNEYRTVFEQEASRVLGRRIRVRGDVDLRLLPSPYVRFDDLRIADSTGHFRQPLLKADSFTMHLSVSPLLQGTLEASAIAVNRPELRLAFDEAGAGNWSVTATGADPRSLYLPRDVALQAVRIVDGTIGIFGPGNKLLRRLEKINGNLSATSLQGPFEFKGAATDQGLRHDVRIVSKVARGDGKVPFSAVVTTPDLGSRITLDGGVITAVGEPVLSGDLVARLPVKVLGRENNAAQQGDGATSNIATKVTPGAERSRDVDVKAKLSLDGRGLRLANMSLGFEQSGRPQILTGVIESSWASGIAINASFASAWLDLDQAVAGSTALASPVDVLYGVVGLFEQWLGRTQAARAILSIDQANLGGETVSGLQIDAEKRDGKLLLRALHAAMPGEAHFAASGEIAGSAEKRTFDGIVRVRGENLSRFLKWAGMRTPLPVDLQRAGYFGARSQVRTGTGWLEARNLAGRLAGTAFDGDVTYRWRDRRSLQVDLTMPRLDLTALQQDEVRLVPALRAGLVQSRDFAEAGLKLRIGRLKTGSAAYRDVVVDVMARDGNVALNTLRLLGAEDLEIELDGKLAAAHTAPRGQLSGKVVARSSDAVARAAAIFDIPADAVPAAARAAALAPLRLAGRLVFKGASQPSVGDGVQAGASGPVAISVRGTAGGTRLNMAVTLERGLEAWRDSLTDVAISATHDDPKDLMRQLLPGLDVAGLARLAQTPGTGPAAMRIRAAGTGKDGLVATASLRAGALNLRFDGDAKLTGDGVLPSLKGLLTVDVPSPQPLLAITGIDHTLLGTRQSVRGGIELDSGATSITLTTRALVLGSQPVSGRVMLARKGDGTRHLTGRVDLAQVGFFDFLSPILATSNGSDPAPANVEVARTTLAGTQREGAAEIWPDTPFSFSRLDGLTADLTIGAKSMIFAEGMRLADVETTSKLGVDRKASLFVHGDALGGKVEAAVQLAGARAGATATGTVKAVGVDLAKLLPSGSPSQKAAAEGQATAMLSFSGRALSPRGLAPVLRGEGTIEFQEATVHRMTPAAIRAAADAVIDSRPDEAAKETGGQSDASARELDALRNELKPRLAAGDLPLGARQTKLTAADGALAVERLVFDLPEGTTSVIMTVDLASLRIDSEWRIAAKPGKSAVTGRVLAALPPVTVTYAGPISDISSLEPRIDPSLLARELTVRRMEREVEQLEVLRRQDEARAAEEAAREAAREATRKAREAERRRAEEAALERAQRALIDGSDPAVPPLAPGLQPPDAAGGGAQERPGQSGASGLNAQVLGTAGPSGASNSGSVSNGPGTDGQPQPPVPVVVPRAKPPRKPVFDPFAAND